MQKTESKAFNILTMTRVGELSKVRYLHTDVNEEMWQLLVDLSLQVNPESPKPKVMGALITGPPHSGKTTAIKQFAKAYMLNVPGARDEDIVLFQIPQTGSRLKGVMISLGKQLGVPGFMFSRKSTSTDELIQLVASKLWMDHTKLVIIDEFQCLFDLSRESRKRILSGFNYLINSCSVPIILVGVDGVNQILNLDKLEDPGNLRGSFSSRFPEFKMKPWDNGSDHGYIEFLYTLIDNFKGDASEPVLDFLESRQVRKRILEMTGGLTGKIVHLFTWMARLNVRTSSKMTFSLELMEDAFQQIVSTGWR